MPRPRNVLIGLSATLALTCLLFLSDSFGPASAVTLSMLTTPTSISAFITPAMFEATSNPVADRATQRAVWLAELKF